MSFSIKSSHQLVNPKPLPSEEPQYIYDRETKKVIKNPNKGSEDDRSHRVNNISNVKAGSKKGMAVRTTQTSQEDFY